MNYYMINTPLGLVLMQAKDAIDAFIEYVAADQPLENLFLNREDLEKRGFTVATPTKLANVFELSTERKHCKECGSDDDYAADGSCLNCEVAL